METLLAGTVFFVIAYVVAVGTMFSFVGVRPDALVVRNPHQRWVIPWDRVEEVHGFNGLRVTVKGLAKPLYCVAFQQSLLGAVFGHSSAIRAARIIDEYRRQLPEGGAGATEITVEFPWRTHLAWIGIGWTFAVLAMSLIGRVLGPM